MFQEYDQQPEEHKPIQVSEAHTTKDSAYNYTLIQVTTKVREPNVQLFMDYMTATHNIKKQYITGYETVDGVSGTSEAGELIFNPVLKIIIQHYYGKHENLLEPYINREIRRTRGVFQSLTAKYPQIKEFISSLSLSDGLDKSDANEPKKRPRTAEANDGASCPAMVMEAMAQPVSFSIINERQPADNEVIFDKAASELRCTLDATTRELELLKDNYSTLERSSLTIRSTTQAAIDELTTAGAEKDVAIAALTASNTKKDEVINEKDRTIRALESLTAACGSIMDLLKTSTDDAKLQRAQHTNDLETKIDQVRTAVISRAEGTGRQITAALDSHGETMVAEMERMMQEKGACEQHVMEKYQRASAKANRYAQTKKGVFTKKFNKAKKAYVAEIQKLKTDLVVETKIRQCVINNFFELIPISSDRQTAKQHRPKESPPTPP